MDCAVVGDNRIRSLNARIDSDINSRRRRNGNIDSGRVEAGIGNPAMRKKSALIFGFKKIDVEPY